MLFDWSGWASCNGGIIGDGSMEGNLDDGSRDGIEGG